MSRHDYAYENKRVTRRREIEGGTKERRDERSRGDIGETEKISRSETARQLETKGRRRETREQPVRDE